jgi:hypothetical protein
VATLMAFVLLTAVVLAIGWRQTSAPRVGVFVIPPSELDLVRDDYATLRVQHAIEEYRFASGTWPSQLRELADRGVLEPSELASEQGRPYYYAERAEGAVLLAPER